MDHYIDLAGKYGLKVTLNDSMTARPDWNELDERFRMFRTAHNFSPADKPAAVEDKAAIRYFVRMLRKDAEAHGAQFLFRCTPEKLTKSGDRITGLTVVDGEGVTKLDHVSFTAMGGEILGIAGVAGSGQKELLEAVAGLCPIKEGKILYTPEGKEPSDLVGKTPMQIKDAGVAMAFVPEDRLGMGLVGGMGMVGNMMLRSWREGGGIFVRHRNPGALAKTVMDELEVVTPDVNYPVRRLSGGNVQKVLVGREIATAPSVLMSAYAVRGLDINTSYTIYNLMNQQKEKGVAVIFVGEDLDVLLELCDRILVLYDGRVSGIVNAREVAKEEVGLMMTRLGKGENADA